MIRLPRYAVQGGTAVVTGAAGGIGEALATELAARGSHLVLLDRDADRLAGVASSLRRAHPTLQVRTHVVDLADAAATARAADAVLAASPRVTLLVDNAGVALLGRFDQVGLEEFWWVVEVNLRATVQLTHALLPALRASPGSHVVTVSSVFGLVAPSGQVAYATSKAGVRAFTSTLRAELAPLGVGVTVVHPGGVATRIARDARPGGGVDADEVRADGEVFTRLLPTPPPVAARAVVDGVERRRPRVLVGSGARLFDVVARLLPGRGSTVVTALQAVQVRRVRRALRAGSRQR